MPINIAELRAELAEGGIEESQLQAKGKRKNDRFRVLTFDRRGTEIASAQLPAFFCLKFIVKIQQKCFNV